MDFDQFKIQVVDEMRERFPDLDIGIQAVSKLQGESYTGLAVSPADSNVAATMNLDYVYKRVEDGMTMETALHNIEKQVAEIAGSMPQFDTRALMDYDQMKEKLTLQMIPIAGNEERLSEIPHRAVEDMALVYRFEMKSNEQGSASILVTNNMLRTYDITADQLHSDAMEAAVQNHPATLRNMNDVMRDMMGDAAGMFIPDEPSPIWVATVEGGQNGACAIQYPDFLDQAAETMGGDFYVLPSSIHELLFIADDGSMELSHLEEMVRSINEAEVAPADRLSDNVFHYDSEEHIFENARTFEAREAARVEAMLADEPVGFMETDTITMLLVEPNEHPKVIEAKTGLEDLQHLVGGFIEVVYPFEDPVGLIVNEEGKINGLPLNRALRDENNEVYDVIAGSFLVTGLTEDSFGSLTPEQIGKVKDVRAVYENIKRNTYSSEDQNIYERMGKDMEFEKLGLTLEQTEILYNLEFYKTLNDAQKTKLPINGSKIQQMKLEWLSEWKTFISSGFSSFTQTAGAEMHWYNKEDLIKKVEENHPYDTWFRLVLLEVMLFEPYYPLGLVKDKKGNDVPDPKYKDLHGPVIGYKEGTGNAFLEEFFNGDYYQKGYVKRLRKCYSSVLRELNEVLKTAIKSIVIAAGITIAAVATAGAFAPAIAVALVGSNFAGLSGAALTSACLAYLGGGAIAIGGAGMAGGTIAIVGGGAALGLGVGAGVGGAASAVSLSGKKGTILQSAKLMVSVREIFLNDDHDVAYSNSILEKYVQNIAEIEKGLVELRLKADVADKAEKKKLKAQIKSAEDSVEAMKIARKSMAKFVSSYEIGLTQQ